MEIAQFDVKTAFVYGDLKPKTPKCWYEKLQTFLKMYHFYRTYGDPCVYIAQANDDKIYLSLYVDDGLILTLST